MIYEVIATIFTIFTLMLPIVISTPISLNNQLVASWITTSNTISVTLSTDESRAFISDFGIHYSLLILLNSTNFAQFIFKL